MITRYRLCGETLETDWPLRTRLLSDDGEASLHFSVTDTPPRQGAWTPIHLGSEGDAKPGWVGSTEVVRFPLTGDAWFLSDDEVVFHLTHPENDFQVEVILLGILLAYWLERRGSAALHGSAVSLEGRGVGILGPNGSGKTSVALDLVEMGHDFLTDDLLAVSLVGDMALAHPSFPQTRLWPEEAETRLGSAEGLELAHPNYDKLRVPVPEERFDPGPVPLVALYVNRPPGVGEVEVEAVEGPPALFHLMLNGFARDLVHSPLGRSAWLRRLSALLAAVPVFYLPGPDVTASTGRARLIADHVAALAQSKRPS